MIKNHKIIGIFLCSILSASLLASAAEAKESSKKNTIGVPLPT